MHRNSFRAALVRALLTAVALLPCAAAHAARRGLSPQDDPAAALIAKLRDKADTADPRLVQELADLRTRAAAQGLIDLYGAMNTTYMKREIVRALVQFDGVPDAEQPALQHLTDVATQAKEPELRDAALAGLGRAVHLGKDFLKMIALSTGQADLRVKAFELHVPLADAGDKAWYRQLWKPTEADVAAVKEQEKERQRKLARKPKKVDGKEEPVEVEPQKGRPLDEIRVLAFEALAPELTADELADAVENDRSATIRRTALAGLEQRGDKRAVELAEAVFKGDESSRNRVLAAQIVARAHGAKAAPELMKRALASTSSVELQRGLADVLVGFGDPAIEKALVNELGKGSKEEKLFALYAVRSLADERIDKALHKMLADKDPAVVVETARTLGFRKNREALPLLAKLVEKSKEQDVVRAAIEAQSEIEKGGADWAAGLLALAAHADPEIRAMALQTMAESKDAQFVAGLVRALDDPVWSVRVAALRGLELTRTKEVVGPILARAAKEEGRLRRDFVDALFRLTGQPWDLEIEGWNKWWKENEATYELVSPAKLAEIRKAEEDYRLKQTTTVDLRPNTKPESKFFGIKIESHRVIFVVDISGSKEELLTQEYEGKAGLKRMDVAKKELAKSIEALDENAFFNIVTFSSAVERWPEGGLAAANPKNQADAKAHIEGLLPFGGTNIYGAIRAAFDDPDVDTILFMSDGEPSVGEETELLVIREHVKHWNEHRGVVIHTIAVGGSLQILEWLAEDSGGTHVKFE